MSFLLFFGRREFNVGHSETTIPTDVQSAVGAKNAQASDALSAGHNQSSVAIIISSQSDAGSSSDALSAISNLIASQSDSASSADSVTCFFAQIAIPDLDISGGWTPSSGIDLYAMIDESAPDQNDYIHTHVNAICEVRLSPLSTPPSKTDHVVRYAVKAGSGTITVRLMQGAVEIANWSHAMSGSAQEFIEVLSQAQATNITNYADLRLKFESSL